MSYPGENTNQNSRLIYSAATNYTLSAAATETAYSAILGTLNLAIGDSLTIVYRGTTAGNANNKTILVELIGGTTVSFQNNNTAAPNGRDFVMVINGTVKASNELQYHMHLTFDATASEVQTGVGTVTLTSGSVRVDAKVTGLGASDVVTYGLDIYIHRKDTL